MGQTTTKPHYPPDKKRVLPITKRSDNVKKYIFMTDVVKLCGIIPHRRKRISARDKMMG